MIGVRKNSGVIRLLMAAVLVLFVAACSSSSDNSGLERERDQALETVEELEGTVEDLTESMETLMDQLAALQESGTDADQKEIEMLKAQIATLTADVGKAETAQAMEERRMKLALFKGLNPGVNPPFVADPGDAVFQVLLAPNAPDATPATTPVTAKHGEAAKVAQAASPDNAGENTWTLNNALAKAKGALSDGPSPWSSTLILATDTVTKDKDTVRVYTDIAAATSLAFAKAFPVADFPKPTNATADSDAIAVTAEHDKYIESVDFSTDSGVKVHGTSTDKMDEQIRIPGMFSRAAGEYVCIEGDTNDCTSQASNAGIVLTGNWSFDPNDNVMAQKADDEYAHFGWWWRIDDTGGYHVDVFHGHEGGKDIVKADFDPLTGSATYTGPAAGKHVINPQLPGEEVKGGHFTATATLKADFEAPGAADPGRISGTINGFMQDDLELPYVVTFGATTITSDDNAVNFAKADAAVWSISEVKSSSKGSWSGEFHNQGKDMVPTTVTGEFAATYNDEVGRIEGAFGARK